MKTTKALHKDVLLELIKLKAQRVIERKFLETAPLYFKQKYNEIENQKRVEHIIWSLDLENQRELKKELTQDQWKELRFYFDKQLA